MLIRKKLDSFIRDINKFQRKMPEKIVDKFVNTLKLKIEKTNISVGEKKDINNSMTMYKIKDGYAVLINPKETDLNEVEYGRMDKGIEPKSIVRDSIIKIEQEIDTIIDNELKTIL